MPETKKDEAQRKGFIETVRQLECDEDKERFEEKLDKIAKAKSTSTGNPPAPRSTRVK